MLMIWKLYAINMEQNPCRVAELVKKFLSFYGIRRFIIVITRTLDVTWVLSQHGMALLWVGDGRDGLQIWRVTANVLNKWPRTAH